MQGLHEVRHFIDGESRSSEDGATFSSISPIHRRPWAEVARGTSVDIQAAVDAARRAFDQGRWSESTPDHRRAVLHRFAGLIEERRVELAELDVWDVGKPVRRTRTREVDRSAAALREAADQASMLSDESYGGRATHHMYSAHQPIGVVGAIAPWNYPIMMAANKIAQPLAYGNSVVLKPAEQSPASAFLLAQIALEAGLPPGVLNVVHGFGEQGAGDALVRHEDVQVITFTGNLPPGARSWLRPPRP